MLDILRYSLYITLFSEVLPFIFLLLFFKRITTVGKRGYFFYALLTAILAICLLLFRYVYPDKVIFFLIGRIHTIIEFSLLAYLFSLFIKNKVVKKTLLILIIPFCTLCLVDYFLSKTPSIDYITLLIECLFFILLIIYFFFEKMKQDVNESLFASFTFWFAVAFLLNFSGNFLLFVYSETSNKEPDFKTNYAIIYSTVTIIKNILLCIAITMKESINKNISSNNTILTTDNPLIFTPNKTSSI